MEDRDMFKQMRRSSDPKEREVGEVELRLWQELRQQFGGMVEWMLGQADTPELREKVMALKRELEDRSTH